MVPAGEVHGDVKASDAFQRGHLRQYVDLVEAIEGRRHPGVTAQDALLALAAVRAVYVSATLHQPIEFARVLAGDYDNVTVVTS